MKLSKLDKYDDIVIQMHDNPDADAVGAGYAMYSYFRQKGKKARLIYGGKEKINKSNMIKLINELNIPADYVKNLEETPELLLTVDCQYGEGNVEKFDAQKVAMIDHHNTGKNSDEMSEIRSNLVSCSTICYDMIRKTMPELLEDKTVATALYYGLYMDSNGFSEIRHPLDKDMMDFLKIDKEFVKELCYSNYTLEELETAGIALLRNNYDPNKKFTIINSKPCDPNILGVIGDIVLQVDSIGVCIIYSDFHDGYKISIRSCQTYVAANDLAAYLTKNIGNGGGHIDKAGGFISKELFEKRYKGLGIDAYMYEHVSKYYDSFIVVKAEDGIADKSEFELYQKKNLTYGYVKSTDICEVGKELKLRTIEGDVYIVASEDIYIMIGYRGEIYPIEKKVFESKYSAGENNFVPQTEFEYIPAVIDTNNSNYTPILGFAKECFCNSMARVFAKKLDCAAKVFTKWDFETYMLGNVGDYICYSAMDEYDIYIVNKDIFKKTYDKV